MFIEGRDFRKADVVLIVGSFCGCSVGGGVDFPDRGLPILITNAIVSY